MTLSIPTLILSHATFGAACVAAYHFGPSRMKEWLLALVRLVLPNVFPPVPTGPGDVDPPKPNLAEGRNGPAPIGPKPHPSAPPPPKQPQEPKL